MTIWKYSCRAFKKLRKVYRLSKEEDAASALELLKQYISELGLKVKKILGYASVRSRYGVTIASNWNDRTFELYVSGGYGRFYAERLKDMNEPFYFVDVGANQGLYSLLAASNSYCKGVYAFEPVPQTARRLAQNAALNDVSDKVQVIEKAISNTEEKAFINMKNSDSGLTSMESHLLGDKVIEIECVNSEGLDRMPWQDDAKFVVKIDVEGHEQTVIGEILKSAFSKNITEIFYECDENWIDPKVIINLLKKGGFINFQKLGEKDHYDMLAQK